jgi:TRAP-type C4-dicarboxylate transport system permease small subunit
MSAAQDWRRHPINGFWNLLTVIVVTCFSLMLVVMLIQIASRYVFGIGVPWTDEVSRYLYISEIFLGTALAQRRKEHIRISVVTDLLPKTGKKVAACIADIITLLVSAMLVYGAIHMMKVTKGVYASTFNMSFSYLYLIQISGIVLFSLLVLRDMFSTFSAKVQESESTSGSQEQ